MTWKREGTIFGCVSVLLLAALPARAQKTGCNASPDAAVQCFVRNGVNSGLARVPAGMSMADFRAYGVSVSKIVQTPPTLVFVLGTMAAVADALPATSANSSAPNQAAQDAAVDAIVDAGLKAGLIALPENTTAEQLKMFAHSVCAAMDQYHGAAVAPGAMLRFLDSYVMSATSAGGMVNWSKVQASISNFIDSLVSSHLLTIPAGSSAGAAKQFANDVAVAIHNYKTATGKTAL